MTQIVRANAVQDAVAFVSPTAMLAIQAEIAALRAQVAAMRSAVDGPIDQRFQALRNEIARLERELYAALHTV